MAWIPPGQSANHRLWRYDVAQKSFLPPGVPGKPKGTVVELPAGYQGNEPTGFHMVASPAGTQAPLEHINYTPDTGEVHGRGQVAPQDKLNYTLMPTEALMPQTPTPAPVDASNSLGAPASPQGMGTGQQMARSGMGAGAAVPSLGAQTAPAQFAGTPPLMGSPTLNGPSPTTNASMPTWGGGGTQFDTRMGMGAETAGSDSDLFTDSSATDDGTSSGGTTGGSTSTQGQGTQAGKTYPPGTPKHADGTYVEQGVPEPMYGTDTSGNQVIIGYRTLDSINIDRQPVWHYSSPPTPVNKPKDPQAFKNADGSIDVVDFSTNPPTVNRSQKPDPALVAKADLDAKVQAAQLALTTANTHVAQAKDANAVQLAQAELEKARADAQRAQSDADKAAIDAAHAGQPTPAAKPAKITDTTGEVWILNNDTGQYEDAHIKEDAGTWKEYDDPVTQTHRMFNPNTQQDILLAPIDQYKQYPPVKSTDGSGKWIQWDPTSKTYKTVYTETPDSTTEWSGDQLISVDKATKAVKVIWKKTPTQAENDAHDAAIDAHNAAQQLLEKTKQDMATGKITAAQARVSMEKDLQEILHPKPMFSPQGDVFAPPGLTLNLQDWNPITGERGTRTLSGGGVDPRVDKMMAQLDAYLGGGPAPGPAPEAVKPPFDPNAAAPNPVKASDAGGGRQTNTDTTPGERGGDTVGTQLAAPGDRPGYPGWDPQHLGGKAQPPTTRTTAAGDRAHYDENGNLTGIDYINTAPPGYVEGQGEGDEQTPTEATDAGEEYFDPESGKRTGSEGLGTGTDTAGWVPRPGAINPANGPGFLGAGADGTEQPFDPEAALSQADTQLSPGGHKPGVDILPSPGHIANPGEIKGPGPAINTGVGLNLPGSTDQGVDWIPGLHDLVTQKVNESLKELLGWPKLEHTPPPEGPPHGTQGGFDQPDIDPYDVANKKPLLPQEPSDLKKPPNVKDMSHILGEGGTNNEDWDEMANEEGIGRAAGKNADPEMMRILQEKRDQLGTTGVGQDEAMPPDPGATMPPSGASPTPAQTPPQGPGGEQPPQWLLTLLKAHPELLQMAGIQAPPAGGATPPGASPAGWQPPTPPAPPTPPTPTPPTPPTGAGADMPMPPPDPSASPAPGGAPVAPSPEGAPMTPPLDPSDVAGIGHRFGQNMNVGEPQHSGVDLQAPEGTPTQSPVDGFVTRVENNPQGLGVTVVIQGMDGSEHRLGHLKETSAYAGQQVKMGQDLGSPVGETGMTTGAHLHWGVKDGDGQPADPTQALGPMASMPPVPGTEMMGPPGGVGGAAQQGQPQAPVPPMGGGHDVGWKPRRGKKKVGAGAEGGMGAGATEEWSALQQQLQQTWNGMQQGQMSPGGLGSRMAPQGSMFGVPAKPPQPPPTMRNAAPPQAPQPPPQGGAPAGGGGGGGGGGGIGGQMSGFLQPGGAQGGGAFAKAGGMPMKQSSPQGAPPGQNYPAQATTGSQQAGWTPQ